ncbi:transketolase [Erysipelotrichaceae bacterium]|nr:transketolase [Erysipelotrichaceae bacterium]
MIKKENIEMRQVYTNKLIEFAEKGENIIALEADLMSAIAMKPFAQKYPNKFINCGIMEANMVGVGAGHALLGKKVFIHTFGPFATRRCFDQLFISLGYAQLPAVILGSDSGVTAEHNGGTHMPFEDLGLMRLIPSATVFEASDSIMLAQLLEIAKDSKTLTYIRTIRKQADMFYTAKDSFKVGGSKVLRDGADGVIFASGIMVSEAVIAANTLAEAGIDIAVVDTYSIAPIDSQTIIRYAQKTGYVITAENHNVIGGLGSAVAEVLLEAGIKTKFKRVGVRSSFGQVGTRAYLQKVYGLDAETIIKTYHELKEQ